MRPIIEITGQLSKPTSCRSAAFRAVRAEADKVISPASGFISEKPLPAMAGAMAFGVAMGCLIMSGRTCQEHETRGHQGSVPFDAAGDVVSHLSQAFGRVLANLKFW